VCVFITVVPSTKMFAWGWGDMGGHVLQEMTSRGLCGLGCPSRWCVFITAGPSTKLFAWGGGNMSMGGHVLRETTSRGLGVWVLCAVCLLLQYLIQSCARGGRRIVEDMCYEIRRAEACVD
jgi:hypothetical protein